MTSRNTARGYKAPESVPEDYVFSRKDWPGIVQWLRLTHVSLVDSQLVFGGGLDLNNCLFVTPR